MNYHAIKAYLTAIELEAHVSVLRKAYRTRDTAAQAHAMFKHDELVTELRELETQANARRNHGRE
jgi:hypothetical protein